MSFKVGDKVQWIGNGECGNYVDPNIYTVSKVVPAGFKVTGNGVHDVFYTNNETASFKLIEPGPNQVIEELQRRLAEQDAAADHDHDYLAELERKLNRAVELQKSAEARVVELMAQREAWKAAYTKVGEAMGELLRKHHAVADVDGPAQPETNKGPRRSFFASNILSSLESLSCSPSNPCSSEKCTQTVTACACWCHLKADPV